MKELPPERREILDTVAGYVSRKIAEQGEARLTFICTHNSRRSHLAQIWAQVAAHAHGVRGVKAYSGGTEATACDIRTVRALRRAGLSVVTQTMGANPVYLVQYADAATPIKVYSKIYNAGENAQKGYAAVLCCSDADAQCPMAEGADARIRLLYLDPKEADDTPEESARYDERCRQIAAEMFYLMSRAAQA